MSGGRLKIRAIVFDLDGTLVDTVADLTTATNAVRRQFGHPPLPTANIRNLVGKGAANLIRRALTVNDCAPDEATFTSAMLAFEREYSQCLANASRPYPGVVDGLQQFSDRKFKLGCVTNKPSRFAAPLLERTGLATFFSLVLAGDSLPRKKPDPLPMLHAAEVFDVLPSQLLVIGDSGNDALAARNAGCPVFLVPYGYREGLDIAEIDCDRVVPGLAEAAEFIENAV